MRLRPFGPIHNWSKVLDIIRSKEGLRKRTNSSFAPTCQGLWRKAPNKYSVGHFRNLIIVPTLLNILSDTIIGGKCIVWHNFIWSLNLSLRSLFKIIKCDNSNDALDRWVLKPLKSFSKRFEPTITLPVAFFKNAVISLLHFRPTYCWWNWLRKVNAK